MRQRKIYILRTGGLSKIDNQFHFYDLDVFSSLKKINEEINSRIVTNKGINVRSDEGYRGRDTYNNTLITYDCLDVDGNPMTIRYEVLEKKLN